MPLDPEARKFCASCQSADVYVAFDRLVPKLVNSALTAVAKLFIPAVAARATRATSKAYSTRS